MDPKLRSTFQLLKLRIRQVPASHRKPFTMHDGACGNGGRRGDRKAVVAGVSPAKIVFFVLYTAMTK
jgi:hypothetical protein